MSSTEPGVQLGPVMCVVGARPNFMRMAPILRALAAHQPAIPMLLVHTGQHYDKDMSDRLFEDLRLPRPDINLEVGSASHAVQTAEVMRRFEPLLDTHCPSCVVVLGDVKQRVYEFRGADHRFLTKAKDIWQRFGGLISEEWFSGHLPVTYRLSAPLCQFLNEGMNHNPDVYMPMTAGTTRSNHPVVFFIDSEQACLFYLLNMIQKIVSLGYGLHDIAILVSSFKSDFVKHIMQFLTLNNIPIYIDISTESDTDSDMYSGRILFKLP